MGDTQTNLPDQIEQESSHEKCWTMGLHYTYENELKKQRQLKTLNGETYEIR